MKSTLLLTLGCLLLAGCAANDDDPLLGLRTEDDGAAREAIAAFVARGDEAIPALREGLEDADPRCRYRARTALAKITGQWGSEGRGIPWKRSVDEAVNDDRPLMVLHLFGKLDEEFC